MLHHCSWLPVGPDPPTPSCRCPVLISPNLFISFPLLPLPLHWTYGTCLRLVTENSGGKDAWLQQEGSWDLHWHKTLYSGKRSAFEVVKQYTKQYSSILPGEQNCSIHLQEGLTTGHLVKTSWALNCHSGTPFTLSELLYMSAPTLQSFSSLKHQPFHLHLRSNLCNLRNYFIMSA